MFFFKKQHFIRHERAPIDNLRNINCAMFKHGFILKINKYYFNFKVTSLTAVPVISKLSTLQQCSFSWQCFLIALTSSSIYFNAFSVNTDIPKCSY